MANLANWVEHKKDEKGKEKVIRSFTRYCPFILFSAITKYSHLVIIILIMSDMLFSFSTVLSSQPPLRYTGIHTALPEHILLRCPSSELH